MKTVSKFSFILMLTIFIVGCTKRKTVDGVRIDTFWHAMKDNKSNKKVSTLVSQTLKHDENALSELINYWCGGGADCYELGFVLSQIVYKMGESDFSKMAGKLSLEDKKMLRFELMCGLEYGDHDATGGEDNRRIDVEFPILSGLLDNYLPERTYQTQIKSTYYLIGVNKLDASIGDETELNAVFTILKRSGDKFVEFYKDSIHTEVGEIKLADYNGDDCYDILVQNFSDVRSNWTYYLYLLDYKNLKLLKIKGFEEIKNPRYLRHYNLIDNYVNSGRNWTQFHKIQGDSVMTLPFTIYDGIDAEDTNLVSTYEMDYNNALRKILKQ